MTILAKPGWRLPVLQAALASFNLAKDACYGFAEVASIAADLVAGVIDVAEANRLLDEHVAKYFPNRWKPSVRGKRDVSPTFSRKRAQYAEIQRLYKTRRKDAATTVISGAWQQEHLPD